MRTTLTLDEDVAARLEQARRRTGDSFRQVVNETLRRGLDAKPARAPGRFRVKARDLGLRDGLHLDNIGELLEQIDGPSHK